MKFLTCLLAAVLAVTPLAHSADVSVLKTSGTNAITGDLTFGSGRTLTIASGGTLNVAAGATFTFNAPISIPATSISDSTAAGRALLTAANVGSQIGLLGLATVATSGSYSDLSGKPTFNTLSPMTTAGDMIYGGASGAGTRVAGNSTTTKKFLNQTGDGLASAAPAWAALINSDIPTTLTGKTLSGSSNTFTNIPLTSAVTGLLPQANGGTGYGVGFSAGQILIGRGDGTINKTTITQGNGIHIVNGSDGTIMLSTSIGDFAAGNLVPLFTTTVTNPSTNPTLSFVLTDAAQHAVLAGPSGAAGAPTYRALVASDLPATAVTAGSYGSATSVGTFTVDAQGRLTTAATTAVSPITVGTTAISPGGTSTTLAGLTSVTSTTFIGALTGNATTATTATTASSVALSGVTGLGTGVATFLSTPTSANLKTAVTDETGSGALVFATSPALITPALGVATATSINGNTITTGTGTLTLGSATLNIGTGGTLGSAAFTDSSSYFNGPASATDNAIVRFDGTTGKLGQNSTVTIADAGTVTIPLDGIAATSTDGTVLSNSTAATVGAQQWSPRMRLTGQGWKTNSTAGSQSVDWIQEVQPVQAAANPYANLVFSSQVNSGGYATRAYFTDIPNGNGLFLRENVGGRTMFLGDSGGSQNFKIATSQGSLTLTTGDAPTVGFLSLDSSRTSVGTTLRVTGSTKAFDFINGTTMILKQSDGTSMMTWDGVGLTTTFNQNAIVSGTNTLKFGATAAATIGVSADTTAGTISIIPPSTGTLAVGAGTSSSKKLLTFPGNGGNGGGIGTRSGNELAFFNDQGEIALFHVNSSHVFRWDGDYSFGWCNGLTSSSGADVGFNRVSAGVLRLSLAETSSTTSGTLVVGTTRYGDATNGPTVVASGSSPNQSLVLTGGGGTGIATLTNAGIFTVTGGTFRGTNYDTDGNIVGHIQQNGSSIINWNGSQFFPTTHGGTGLGSTANRWALSYFSQAGMMLGNTSGSGPTITATGTSPNESLVLTPGGTGSILIPSTSTAKFGATAAATIGVSADTTAGVMTFTSPSAGSFLFTGPTLGISSTSNAILTNLNAGTGARYMQFQNTGAQMILGVESSVGGSVVGGSSAYNVVLGSQNLNVQVAAGNSVVSTFSPSNITSTVPHVVAADTNGIGLFLKGRASDNLGQIYFKDNTNATLYAGVQATSVGSGTLNLFSSGATGTVDIYSPTKIASFGTGLTMTGGVGLGVLAVAYGSDGGRLTVLGQSGVTSTVMQVGLNGDEIIAFRNASGIKQGSIVINSGSTAFNTSSDARLKSPLRSWTLGDKFDQIHVGEFDWKAGGTGHGVLAQELHKVFPDAVTAGDTGKTITKQWGVDYGRLTIPLIVEVQALRKRVAALESRTPTSSDPFARVVASVALVMAVLAYCRRK